MPKTAREEWNIPIQELIERIVCTAHYEHFDANTTSVFETNILALYREEYSDLFLNLFFDVLEKEQGEVLREALVILGRIQDRKTSLFRRNFIHKHLYHDETVVREGALSAIEYMEHSQSIRVLRQYLQWETVSWLREYAESILVGFLSYLDEEMIYDHALKAVCGQTTVILSSLNEKKDSLPLEELRPLPLADAIGAWSDSSVVVPDGRHPVILPLTFNPKKG